MFRISNAVLVLVAVFAVGALASTASANHTWSNFHWARSANPLPLKIGDNVTSTWDSYLVTARNDWNASTVLETSITAGSTNPKQCRPVAGTAQVCNAKYGNNGWLGIAQVWVNGDHITQGTVKLNDTYFSTAGYNTPAWRNLVTCQEVGHIFGLAHQDENFSNANLGTCMDYTNLPESNQHPNAHDYTLLEQIYAHLDASNSFSQSIADQSAKNAKDTTDWNDQKSWGNKIDGHMFKKDLGDGVVVYTDVFFVDHEGDGHTDHTH